MQPSSDSKLHSLLRRTSWKQDGITEDQYVCFPLQNLLLSYPGIKYKLLPSGQKLYDPYLLCLLVMLNDKFPENEPYIVKYLILYLSIQNTIMSYID